ncbi:MAG: hypothetical protein COB53_10685 [Elusimicrobia bacterium]|nr:MAG: hypothetical protein COB53_10685 [Elusimicrobiota bacterium]
MKLKATLLPLLLGATNCFPAAAAAKPQDPVLAKVDGVSIKRSEVMERLWQAQGVNMIESLIERKLFSAAAKKAKIEIPVQKIDSRLQAIEKQLPKGQSLKKQLKKSHLSIKDLRGDIGYQILRDEYISQTAEVRVSKEEVVAAFKANKLRLGKPTAFKLRQIVVATEREANDVLIALNAGADFGKLAAAKSLDPNSKDKGGQLGFVSANVLNAKLVEVLEKTAPGQFSPIVQLGETYLILSLEEKQQGVPADFDNVKAGIEKALRENKISQALPAVLKQLRDSAKIERF